MMLLWEWLIGPFAEFAFMRRALVATLALAISAAPLGVFLTLRRMSLLGDALSHAVLPGVAIGFMLFGLSLPAMALGGVVAGLLVAAIAGVVSRATSLKEDASLAAIYLVALALGVTLISRQGSQLDLLHILFGSALGVDAPGLLLVASVASVSVIALAALYRGLVLETFDPVFLAASAGRKGSRPWIWQQSFLMLVVINLVAGFQTLGTLMAVGLMMLPAVSSRLWHDSLSAQLLNASAQAALAGVAGLLLSYHLDTPSGPTIIGCAGLLYGVSLLISPSGWLPQILKRPHRVG
ncbi:MAG: metal ABC transporter permease [Gammaproteobacteria bacterium]|uniref:metal ABC transporter permease n=1 Tax=Rhodoferax sp. TaxID=50421 RepID=UPI00181D3E87|nr:metal ABC transporter permease [Rhodoferax sp.]MBU3899090.1 metal ABC transporter permease [Gammaproteobacteria bacterium]MBA3057610.1 metal ABC transporter permease [Rhodoferax sp.]MBU3997650.1 metal ABC transporter permease [Gammaproteobacteria bacterium]MBU4018534.1 metal ABC transporter permease [Gammaproteobacteria bacterium]MBU4080546.1 metal ABC transporter permease [Gammaproteobacteria bacterium]